MTDRIKDFPCKRNMDLRKDSLRAMRTLDVNNSAVISSLTEKWENKKLKTNCEIRLQEVAAKNDLIKEIMESNLLITNDLPPSRTKRSSLEPNLMLLRCLYFVLDSSSSPMYLMDFLSKRSIIVDDFRSNIGLTRTSPVGHQIEIGNQLSDVNI